MTVPPHPHPRDDAAVEGDDPIRVSESTGVRIAVEPHPLLRLEVFVTRFPRSLGTMRTPAAVAPWLELDARVPLERDEALRTAIRDLLRHGGYKPTGRGKPASEYLVRTASEGPLRPINLAVDACNAISLHSGFPVSVVDLARAEPPFRIAIAEPGTRYVFNPAGQEIDVGGLLCLFDATGPCANAVKDAQRTKTDAATRETLSIVWGVIDFEEPLRAAAAMYRELLVQAGAEVETVVPAF